MKKTPLHVSHLALQAKMGEFAGYDMPLYYKDGVMKEHEWTREKAGLFDVSHMGQITMQGPDAEIIAFWEKLTPSGFAKLKDGGAKYTVLSNDKGGIIDDLIVTRLAEGNWFAVLNSGRKDVDMAWIKKHLPPSLKMEYLEGQGLIAIQGQSAEKALRDLYKIDFSNQEYMTAQYHTLDGVNCLISRLGYTGEDGFEISAPEKASAAIWDKLLSHADVRPVGLAARDSLRLEMGYPLYGHDIDETTTPVEANMNWIVRKSVTFDAPARLRVGVKLLDKGVAREGSEIRGAQGDKIGVLTSGGFSPSLKESIGQGYVQTAFAAPGTKISVVVRERAIAAEVTALSLVPARTKMKKKAAA